MASTSIALISVRTSSWGSWTSTTQLDFVNLKPGSVVAIRVVLKDNVKPHFDKLQELVPQFHNDKGSRYAELQHVLSKLDFVNFNNLLY